MKLPSRVSLSLRLPPGSRKPWQWTWPHVLLFREVLVALFPLRCFPSPLRRLPPFFIQARRLCLRLAAEVVVFPCWGRFVRCAQGRERLGVAGGENEGGQADSEEGRS